VLNAAKTNDWTLQEVEKQVSEITKAKQEVPNPPEEPESDTANDAQPNSEGKPVAELTSASDTRPDTFSNDQSALLSSKTVSSATLPGVSTLYHPGHMVRNVQIDGRKFTTKELAVVLSDGKFVHLILHSKH
jgi:hypothetical protein